MPLIVYYTAALSSLSDSVSYITFLFSECRIALIAKVGGGDWFMASQHL